MWSSSLTAKLSSSRVAAVVDVPWILSSTLRSSSARPVYAFGCSTTTVSPLGQDVQELAAVAAGGDVDDDVELLARRRERRSTPVSNDVDTISCCGSARRRSSGGRPASQRVQERRLEVARERQVELVVQRADPVARRDRLRDVREAAAVDVAARSASASSGGQLVAGTRRRRPGREPARADRRANARITSS